MTSGSRARTGQRGRRSPERPLQASWSRCREGWTSSLESPSLSEGSPAGKPERDRILTS